MSTRWEGKGDQKAHAWGKSPGNHFDSGGVFFASFCTKNKLMKSFKFTGISSCLIAHILADNPTWN